MAGETDMAWARFTADHDHPLAEGAATIAYLRGMRCCVTRAALALAVQLGRAVEFPAPNRPTAEALKADPYAADVAEPPAAAQTPPLPPTAPAQASNASPALPQGHPPATPASEAAKTQG